MHNKLFVKFVQHVEYKVRFFLSECLIIKDKSVRVVLMVMKVHPRVKTSVFHNSLSCSIIP